MYDLAANLQLLPDKIATAISAKPELLINAFGFIAGIFAYVTRSKKELQLQHRNNYFSLELEASRIFTIAVQNPDIPRFLRGEFDNDAKGDDPRMKEQAFWFVSQVLNIFEIAISLRNERTISSELFATWVPWFYELGTYNRFREFWCGRPYDLMYNYRQDLPGDHDSRCRTQDVAEFRRGRSKDHGALLRKGCRHFRRRDDPATISPYHTPQRRRGETAGQLDPRGSSSLTGRPRRLRPPPGIGARAGDGRHFWRQT